jgi:hypothetical protein
MRSLALLVALSLAAAVAGACTEPVTGDEVEVPEDGGDGKADVASELRVRAGDTTVWMTRLLARRDVAGAPTFVLRGRASRNLTGGLAFIEDDVYGDFAVKTARTFEVTWPVSTARGLIDGIDQFVRPSFVASSGRPEGVTTRVVVRPRLESMTGSSKLYLTAELTPVSVGGAVAYRIKLRTSAPFTGLQASIGGVALSGIRTLDPTHAQIDLLADHVLAGAGAGGTAGELVVSASFGGAPASKKARLALSIKKLGITTGDAYEIWPRATCESETAACLAGLPAGTTDLGSCGEYLQVQACAAQGGAFVDDVAFQAALAEGRARVGSAGFRADAAGLVGGDRVEQLVGGAEQTIESRLEGLFGRRYPDVAARTAALAGAIDGAIDEIYARPLEVVQPHAPVAGNLAAMRQVAADALLAELARFDFLHSEYARPLEELTREFRARHVADVRAFREAGELDGNVFAGRWLDPYVEVTIDPATGAASHVLLELD